MRRTRRKTTCPYFRNLRAQPASEARRCTYCKDHFVCIVKPERPVLPAKKEED